MQGHRIFPIASPPETNRFAVIVTLPSSQNAMHGEGEASHGDIPMRSNGAPLASHDCSGRCRRLS